VLAAAIVYPYRWKDATGSNFARDVDATTRWSTQAVTTCRSHRRRFDKLASNARVVLPSPNGATLSGLTGRTPTLAGCLRNADAGRAARRAKAIGSRVCRDFPPANDGPTARYGPCFRGLAWRGARLFDICSVQCRPKTNAAREVYGLHERHLTERLRECASGRELIEQGWEEDVVLASEIGASVAAPMLIDGAYRWPGWSATNTA